MSDTPRTDAVKHEWLDLAMHSRQLERELSRATAERDALLANAMTEEKAREVIPFHCVSFAADSRLQFHNNAWLTALQLKAIAWWIENKGEGK
jgi:hypothetical protein